MARSLGNSDNTLRNWIQADRDARTRAEDPDGLSETERAELARLRRENAGLRADREILRKAAALFAPEDDTVSRFGVVDELRATYEVKRLCRVLEVSRSGYYAWRSRSPSARAVANEAPLGEIRRIHAESRGTYGSPRILGQLQRRGVGASRGRVARLMGRNGLMRAQSRKKWRRGRRDIAPAPDLLARDFAADRPPTNGGWQTSFSSSPPRFPSRSRDR